jgi:hypothetical protein
MVDEIKNMIDEAEVQLQASYGLYPQEQEQAPMILAYVNRSIASSLLAIATMMRGDHENAKKAEYLVTLAESHVED